MLCCDLSSVFDKLQVEARKEKAAVEAEIRAKQMAELRLAKVSLQTCKQLVCGGFHEDGEYQAPEHGVPVQCCFLWLVTDLPLAFAPAFLSPLSGLYVIYLYAPLIPSLR